MADNLKLQFIETSAFTGENVDLMFEMICRTILVKAKDNLELMEEQNSRSLENGTEAKKPKKERCC